VTPVGNPVTLQVTTPLKPKVGVYLAVYEVDLPAVIVRLDGETETEKSPLLTTSAAETWCTREPLVPVTVRLYEPSGAVIVSTVEPAPVTAVGEKLCVAPFGRTVALNVTVPLKPPEAVTVT